MTALCFVSGDMTGLELIAAGTSIICLAQNIYFEARDQPTVGQLAVASVVLNRVHDDRWPNTVCEVVREGPTHKHKTNLPLRDQCQFSWYCDGKSDIPTDAKAWRKATRVAEDIFYSYGLSMNLTDNAMFYHSVDVEPKWTYEYVVTIGDHIFYK
jgi:N-acetylmuramoyl-L-alanine amidase